MILASSVSFGSLAKVKNVDSHSTETRTSATFETSTYVTKDASIKLAVKKNVPEQVYITLRGANNAILYRETINKNEMSYAAKINVSDLRDGTYKLEITTHRDRVVKRLNLTSPKSEVERRITVS